jgi:hypothetical protein
VRLCQRVVLNPVRAASSMPPILADPYRRGSNRTAPVRIAPWNLSIRCLYATGRTIRESMMAIVDRLHKSRPVMGFGVGPSINFEIGIAERGHA